MQFFEASQTSNKIAICRYLPFARKHPYKNNTAKPTLQQPKIKVKIHRKHSKNRQKHTKNGEKIGENCGKKYSQE